MKILKLSLTKANLCAILTMSLGFSLSVSASDDFANNLNNSHYD